VGVGVGWELGVGVGVGVGCELGVGCGVPLGVGVGIEEGPTGLGVGPAERLVGDATGLRDPGFCAIAGPDAAAAWPGAGLAAG
jgi:hypothetical protein